MALGKSLGEIRALSYEEFASWRTYYQLEPFGFHDKEYRTAALLTMLANVNASKKANQKQIKDFTRDMVKLLEKAYWEMEAQESAKDKFKGASKEERMAMIAKVFRGG